VAAGIAGYALLSRRAGAAIAVTCLALALSPAAARAEATADHVPESQWPKDFASIFSAKAGNLPVLDQTARDRFRTLPAHAQKLFFSAAAGGYLSSPSQLATLLGLDLDDRKVELLLADNCVLCHTNPDVAPDESLFRPTFARWWPTRTSARASCTPAATAGTPPTWR